MLRTGVLLASFAWGAAAADRLLPDNEAVHPLRLTIETFLNRQAAAQGFRPTGLGPRDYLRVIDVQVAGMRAYQNPEGRIIDPVIHKEFAFATPCFAHAAAALL